MLEFFLAASEAFASRCTAASRLPRESRADFEQQFEFFFADAAADALLRAPMLPHICEVKTSGRLLATVNTTCPAGSTEFRGAGINLFDLFWCGSTGMGVSAACTFNESASMLVAYTKDLVRALRAVDPSRPISSGFSTPRPSSWHMEHCPLSGACAADPSSKGFWATDTEAQFQASLAAQQASVDVSVA